MRYQRPYVRGRELVNVKEVERKKESQVAPNKAY